MAATITPPLRLVVQLTLAIVLLLAGCAAPAAPTGQSVAPAPQSTQADSNADTVDLVRWAWADVGAPTPFRVSTAGPGGPVLLTLLYDTLVWKDDQGIIPWLAQDWQISPDGLDYTFSLVADATWHDGKPVTAEDVAFTFDYYAEHPYRWVSTAVVDHAEVVGPERVRVRLKQPYAPFLEDVAGIAPIVPKHVWAQVAEPGKYGDADASLGSGPFKLGEYRSAEGAYRLIANPSYFRGAVRTQEIQQLPIPAETRIQAVQQREVELVNTADASVATLFAEDPRVAVLETEPQSIVRLAVNTDRPPLDRKEVRQAITYALDRARIAEVITKGPAVVGSAGVIPPGSPWHKPDVRAYPHDLDRARQMLAGQRYSIELLADPANREPELMQQMLAQVGITLTVKRVDSKTRTQLLREGSFQLGIVQHIGVGGDPDFLRRWYVGEEANDFAQGSIFRDAEYLRLAREQAATIEPAKRRDLVFRMQDILAEELPTITLYYRRFYWVYDRERYTPMNTWGGLLNGAPLVQNKLTFLAR